MVPCFRCGVKLENMMEGRGNQPDDGLEFTTPGHYGSTVFGPMNGSQLAINICDECLKAGRMAGRVLHAFPPASYRVWK